MIDETALRMAVLAEHLDEVDYYALLELPRAAGSDAVRAAFHRFAERFHPDQHIGDAAAAARSLAIFKRGAEAYRVLSNPVLRRRYDDALASGMCRLAPDAMQLAADGRESAIVPPAARVFFDQAVAALRRGELGAARMHLALARARGTSPRFDALESEIAAAEQQRRGG